MKGIWLCLILGSYIFIIESENVCSDVRQPIRLFQTCYVEVIFFSSFGEDTQFDFPVVISGADRYVREKSQGKFNYENIAQPCFALTLVDPTPTARSSAFVEESKFGETYESIRAATVKYEPKEDGEKNRAVRYKNQDFLIVAIMERSGDIGETVNNFTTKLFPALRERHTRNLYSFGNTNRLILIPCWESSPGKWNLKIVHYFTATKQPIESQVYPITLTSTPEYFKVLSMTAFQAHYLQDAHRMFYFFEPSLDSLAPDRPVSQAPTLRQTLSFDKTQMELRILEMMLKVISANRHNHTVINFGSMIILERTVEQIRVNWRTTFLNIKLLIKMGFDDSGFVLGKFGEQNAIEFITCDGRKGYLSFAYLTDPFQVISWMFACISVGVTFVLAAFLVRRRKVVNTSSFTFFAILLEQGINVSENLKSFVPFVWGFCPYLLMAFVLSSGYKGLVISGKQNINILGYHNRSTGLNIWC